MKLQRIRVEQLRQFREPLEITGLAPGINLFTGPNESGKSTLVRAIRAAFFERFKSGSIDDLQPWGDSSASPSVQLAFDWQGERWELSKSFLKRKRCDLTIAGRRYSEEEAEEQLSGLLGYQYPGRGASKTEHWGIPGLLWIEQGSGQDIHESITHAGDYLKSALGESLGEVASSTGDELIGQVTRERAQLLTATGRPANDYAKAIQQHAGCQEQLDSLSRDISTYRDLVDQLETLRQLQHEDATRPWERYHQQAEQATARLAEVQGWLQAQARARLELQHVTESQRLCRDQLGSFAKQQGDLEQRARDRQKAIEALDSQETRRAGTESRLAQAKSAYQAADRACRQTRQLEHRHRLDSELRQLDLDLAQTEETLKQARTLQAQQREQQAQLHGNRVDTAMLTQLRKLGQQLAELDIAQQAIATRLHFDLLPAQHILLGDEPLTGEGQRLLMEPADLDIPGIGKLKIQPGGEDIADLARRRRIAQDKLTAQLNEAQAESLSHAEELGERHRELREDIRRGELLLGSLAASGIDDLLGRQASGMQRRQALQQQLADLPRPTGADVSLAIAESRLETAREQLQAAEQGVSHFERDHSLASQAVKTAQEEWRKLNDALQAPDRRQRETELSGQLVELRAREAALQASVIRHQKQIEAAQPDILRQDVQRFTRTAETLEQEARQRSLELASLRSKLETLGASGLEEQHAELTLQLRHIGRRRDQLEHRAAALDLLKTRRQALTQRIQAPLQRHLNHYLQLLFPQSHLEVDEDLQPRLLVRETHGRETQDDFAALSFGAREQMGLISRLAYADLLKEAGRPTLIILDDALVHSDPQRLAHMKRILFDAGQRHQILLFTCHPDNWRDLGVVATTLQSLKPSNHSRPSNH
ncbi:MAG: AAA family ATPase [Castellaniella sp.]|nr:AAA family ATPase [Castellaniella sp.]